MKNFNLVFRLFAVMIFFFPLIAEAQTTVVIGDDFNSSSTRGPFQRSDVGSSSVYSRANLVYLESELAAAGILPGSTISQIEFDKRKTGKLTASGDAFLKVYMRTTSATEATSQSWTDLITGSTLVGDITYNLANNFPDAQGFMPFPISPYVYNGGTLEIAVDWDSDGLIPADPAEPNRYFDTDNGSITWRWSPTTHVSIANRAGSSGAPSTISNLKAERCDIRITYEDVVAPPPTGPTTTVTIGDDFKSSSTRGPFQRSDVGSSSVYSRANLVYLESELAAVGILPNSIISQINFDKRKTGKLTASGDAFLKIYMRNTSATEATSNSWSALSGGSTLVGDFTYNLANNFPDAQGWMEFPLTPFVYTGGTLEIAVDWNSSGLVPADPAQPNRYFDTDNGAITWRWSPTAHVSVVTKAGSSSAPSTVSDTKSERCDIQIAFAAGTAPGPGTGTAHSVWLEDFDGSNSGPTFDFAATGCIVDDSRDHYGIMCNAGGGCPRPLNEDYTYLGAVGNYFAARDINGDPCNNDNPITATAAGIDISGCSGADYLFLCFDIAESSVTTNPDPTRERRSSDGEEDSWDGEGGDPNGFDTNVTISASVDGGASFPITAFSGVEGILDSKPGLDLNCDGTGSAGAEVSSTFTTFCFQVAEQGTTLDLDLTVGGMTTDGEDVAIDNITLYCTDNPSHLPAGLSPSCTAAANPVAVPTMGEWALFILFLMIINMGAVFMFAMQNKLTLATGENQQVSMTNMMRSFPFEKSNFVSALKHAFGVALVGFAAIYAGWGEIISTDFIGMAVAIPLIAYFIHLFSEKK